MKTVEELAREAGLSFLTIMMIKETEDEKWLSRFRDLVLEEAAKVCETVSLQANASWKLAYQLQDQGRELGADDCAEAIRAMKGQK
jgi:hypothetical protein